MTEVAPLPARGGTRRRRRISIEHGRTWRNVIAVAVLAATAGGSLWGSDDLWPFAPFRMYATATRLDGQVLKAGFRGVTASGEELHIPAGWLGLRPAEVEGQLTRDKRLPGDRLADLAASWNERHPSDEQLVLLELRLIGSRLEEGRPVEDIDRAVQTWEAQ